MEFNNYSSKNLGELALLICDHVNAMLAYWDKDLVCRYANNAYVDWFGKTKEEMIDNIRLYELLGPIYDKNKVYIEAALLGNKQLFEREIPIPDGSGVRYSLATYIPHIQDGAVLGFFAHVADVTYLKNLEKEIASAKRETLRKIIETEETEKRHLVEILRENINQKLAAYKIMLKSEQTEGGNLSLHEDAGLTISEIMQELNLLCQDLTPTEIEMFGLIDAVDLHLDKLSKLHHKTIVFVFEDNNIEKLELKDKYSIFRIVQNFITLAVNSAGIRKIEVSMNYKEPYVKIQFITNDKVVVNKSSKEYHAIACRVDNFLGKMTEFLTESKNIIEFELPIAVM